jgi:hypothetical protein
MKQEIINKIRGNLIISIVIVTLSLFGILVPYSLFLGWNLITLFIFWFILVPIITILTARFYNKVNKRISSGLFGCIAFYLIMIFLIYSHYKTDYFKVMIVSFFTSIYAIWIFSKIYIIIRSKRI